MPDIFQEVEEDVRAERYEKIWKNYGNYIMALAAVVVFGAGAYQAWRSYDLNLRQQMSDRFQAAEQFAATGDAAKAESEFSALATEGRAGYQTLAKFHLANTYLLQNKRDPAIVLLRELTTNPDPVISSAARLKLAWTTADASPRAEIVSTLEPLTAADNPWRFAAAEVMAYLSLKEGARLEAQTQYAQLAAEQAASSSLRQRAAALADYLKANPTNVLPASAPGGAAIVVPQPAAATPAAARPAAPASAAAPAQTQGTPR